MASSRARTRRSTSPARAPRPAPRAATPRASGTATLLVDGRVLLAGGYPGEGRPPTASLEAYLPDSRTFVALGSLTLPRADHSATVLPDGTVLVAGGVTDTGATTATTEIVEPVTGRSTPGPPMTSPRAAHQAVLLGDTLLLVGGTEDVAALATTDALALDRPGGWAPGPSLLSPRVKAGIAQLGNHRALVIGGALTIEGHEKLATTEVIDLGTRDVRPGPDLPAGEYKLDGAVAVLDDGRVVFPSGDHLEVYDPARGTLAPVDTTLAPRLFRTVTPVGPQQVLVAGGYDSSIVPTDDLLLVTIP